MNLLARITRALLFALNPHQQTYTTIIYPVRGQAVVIRDDLNIRNERPWYQAGEAYQAFSSEPIHDLWYRESSQSWELLDGAITADGLDTDTTMLASTDISGGQHMQFNPANGLPMLDGCIDVMGNPMGMDILSDCWSDFSSDSLGFDTSFDFG